MSALTGTRTLLKATLHHDARRVAPWVVLISALSASSIIGYDLAFAEHSDRVAFSTALGANPALSLVFGPARDLLSTDGFNAWRAGQLGSFFAGLMAILIVVRNSRVNEDSGQAELLASGVMSRATRLWVAVLVAVIASVALGVVCWILTVAVGGGAHATAVLAAGFASSALVFTGVAAIAAQLGSDARAASSLAIVVLGAAYVLRGYVDSADLPDSMNWLTPFGWIERSAPATDNDFAPLALAIGCAVVLIAVAFRLQRNRDFGQGLVATPAGPADGGPLATVWGLPLRLHRGSLVGWLAAFVLLGALFGTLASSVVEVVSQNPVMAQVIAQGAVSSDGLVSAFIHTILQIVGIIAAVMGVQFILAIHAEELDHRVSPLLAGSVRRRTYLASNVAFALAATAVAMTFAGAALGVVAAARDESVAFGDVLRQALVTIPAVWTLVAVAVAAVGAVPRVRLIAWLAVVATFGITLLGPTFRLSDTWLGLSVFHHVPAVGASPDWAGLVGVSAIGLILLTIGFVGFRRRDIS